MVMEEESNTQVTSPEGEGGPAAVHCAKTDSGL